MGSEAAPLAYPSREKPESHSRYYTFLPFFIAYIDKLIYNVSPVNPSGTDRKIYANLRQLFITFHSILITTEKHCTALIPVAALENPLSGPFENLQLGRISGVAFISASYISKAG